MTVKSPDELEREHMRRSQALDAAVRLHTFPYRDVPVKPPGADDILKSARKFHTFLKGTR